MHDGLERARHHFQESLIALNKEDYVHAENELRKAHALAPKRPSILGNLSGVLVFQKKIDEAMSLCNQLLEIEPNNIEGLINLGLCHLHLNKHEAAIKYFTRATEIDLNSASAWANKGCVLLELQRLDEALISLDAALKLNPNSIEALIGLGNLYTELRDYELGLEYFSKALKLNPSNAKAQWNKALALLRLGQYEEGWKLYESRWQIDGLKENARLINVPLWLGVDDLTKKTIFIHAEPNVQRKSR